MLFLLFSLAAALDPWMHVADTPSQRANALLGRMTLDEKLGMLHGYKGGYVGNVAGIARLNVPALTLNDGPQGFRDNAHPGSTTAFPSGLTMAATWDVDALRAWGAAMGKEFFDKGSNVQLGPGVCLARVPRNGRNFEYLSGEDPFLGYSLIQPAIKGIQSQGVIANAKHYIDNNQETDRTTVSENVDERTQFEMYLRPFKGATEAGVGSMMCSYNKINNAWSCENPTTLAGYLKKDLNFTGWVMSDWGATHSTSIIQGLDQEMPGDEYMGAALKAEVSSGKVSQGKVDDSVLRILTPMFAVGLFDRPNNNSISNNVTSDAHNMVARELATKAHVLLKNDDGVLPLTSATKTIAVIGTQAVAPIVHGGGSGQVVPAYTISPFLGLRARMGLSPPPPQPLNCTFEDNTDYFQPGNPSAPAHSAADCCKACGQRAGCSFFGFQKKEKTCWFKTSDDGKKSNNDVISGSCYGPVNPIPDCESGKCVYHSDTNDATAGAATAAKAEIAFVFVATTSSEGHDRDSLSLGDAQDKLVAAVAAANANTVVVVTTPGAILMPWASAVKGIFVNFMPGQEAGNAVANVVFGDHNPSGKLPLTMPNIENEMQFTAKQWPGIGKQADYSEGLYIGYRWYDKHAMTPHFPFGHGLSYTSFSFSALTASKSSVTFTLKNTGSLAGVETPQLYLGFPASANNPPKVLRGFSKVSLAAGASSTVTFSLDAQRDLSVWDVPSHAWTVVSGTFQVMIGSSSRDIRLNTTFTV